MLKFCENDLWKRTVSAEFPQNFPDGKLGEISVFCTVFLVAAIQLWKLKHTEQNIVFIDMW